MILSINDLYNKYNSYSDVIGKVNRELKKQNIFSIVKGVYETNKTTPGYLLSSYIYGPSYLSFEYALQYHGLIPERVITYTNASFNKRKSKTYKNDFGTYTYRDIPKDAFPYGIKYYINNNYSYCIASKEKALCDKLYISKPLTSLVKLKDFIFDDLRVDTELFYQLDTNLLLFLCDKYKSSNIKLLKKFILKEMI